MLTNKKIGFIGIGNMGEALIRGLLKKDKSIKSQHIIISDLDKDKLNSLSKELSLAAVENNRETVEQADVVILAVKPKDISKILEEIKISLSGNRKLLISIAAGITTGYVEGIFDKDIAVIRVMPNTPALVGEGMTAICRGKFSGNKDEMIAKSIFDSVGETVIVKEELMDTVTALSGSGPAYIFYIIEKLMEAGAEEGLSPELVEKLVKQTVTGAARMVKETKDAPSLLRKKVTSPGGTTEAALKVFEKEKMGEVVAAAVKAAAERAKELSEDS